MMNSEGCGLLPGGIDDSHTKHQPEWMVSKLDFKSKACKLWHSTKGKIPGQKLRNNIVPNILSLCLGGPVFKCHHSDELF
jgi:hypothetical protein